MLVEVPYGKNKIKVKIDDTRVAGVVVGNDVPTIDKDETIRKAIENPVNSKSLEDFLKDAKDVLFIVNDYLDIALAVDADGLHVGQDDLPARVARRLLPIGKVLGCSVTTVEQAVAAQSEGADYVAASAIYPTASKETVEIVGLETLRQIRKAVTLPLVAIGGINENNAAEVMAAGADSVAIISAILGAESPEKAAREIIAKIERRK